MNWNLKRMITLLSVRDEIFCSCIVSKCMMIEVDKVRVKKFQKVISEVEGVVGVAAVRESAVDFPLEQVLLCSFNTPRFL